MLLRKKRLIATPIANSQNHYKIIRTLKIQNYSEVVNMQKDEGVIVREVFKVYKDGTIYRNIRNMGKS